MTPVRAASGRLPLSMPLAPHSASTSAPLPQPLDPQTRLFVSLMRALTLLLATAAGVVYVANGGAAELSPSGSLKSEMGIINSHRKVSLDPSVQHVPLAAAQSQLRPPPARVSSKYEIFVGLSVFRDGYRCAKTIFTGFARAKNPDLLYFGVVDQVNPGDAKCIDEYCKMAEAQWPSQGACPYRDHIRIDERLADDSRGPTLARHYQQKLLRQEDFCLQLDGHSIFTNLWDENIVAEWRRIDNEMAVLTTYLHHVHDFVKENGDNNVPNSLPHLCTTIRGGNGLVRNEGASMITAPKWPQLSALWGAGLSFSKCHAERRVLVDSHTLWMFDGEEFLRSSHLWTHGYDLYSPSKLGSVVYHNYSKVPARFEHVKVDKAMKALETERGRNRFKLIVGQPFVGEVDAREMDKFAFGNVRTFQDYLDFSGVTFEPGKNDTDTCRQLHWVPYRHPAEVEKIVGGGWKLYPDPVTTVPKGFGNDQKPIAVDRHPEHDEPMEPAGVEQHGQAGAGGHELEEKLEQTAKTTKRQGANGDGPNRLPSPDQQVAGVGGVAFYLFLFGGVIYVVFTNEGVGGNVSNLWRSKPFDTRVH